MYEFVWPPPQSTENSFITPKTSLGLYSGVTSSPIPNPWQPRIWSPSYTVVFSECHINTTIPCTTFWDGLLSLSRMPARFIQAVMSRHPQFIPIYCRQVIHCVDAPVCFQQVCCGIALWFSFAFSPKIEDVEYLGVCRGWGGGSGFHHFFQSHLGEWHLLSLIPLWESFKKPRAVYMCKFKSSCPWIYFYVLICHLCILFGEVPVHIYYPFFNWVVCSLVLSFESSLHITDTSP